jgi:hypothetical protein
MSYFRIAAYMATLLLAGASSNAALAGHSGGGASHFSPGYEMQNPSAGTTVTGNGASGYSPGHQMQNATTTTTTSPEPGASGYTPAETSGISQGSK